MDPRNPGPYGIHEKSHNTIRQALDELDVILNTKVTVPGYGTTPGRELPFDTTKASGPIKTIAHHVIEMDLRLKGQTRNNQISVSDSSGGTLSVYAPDSIAAAQKVIDQTQWVFDEDRYFERRRGSDGAELMGVTNEVGMLLSRVRRDQDASLVLAKARAEHEKRMQGIENRFAQWDAGLTVPAPATPPPASQPQEGSGRTIFTQVAEKVRDVTRGIPRGGMG